MRLQELRQSRARDVLHDEDDVVLALSPIDEARANARMLLECLESFVLVVNIPLPTSNKEWRFDFAGTKYRSRANLDSVPRGMGAGVASATVTPRNDLMIQ